MGGFHKTNEMHLKCIWYFKTIELKSLLDQKVCLSWGILENNHHKGHSMQTQAFFH